ncbi:MAG: hypothetical protein O7G30_10510 [Proteobacteria bacterium]|nr:hypothetical protein [Pseudomonadota bacterium]
MSTALPLPYFGTGALVAALILGLQLGYHALLGYPIWLDATERPAAPIRSTIVMAALIGYVLAAFWTTRDAIFRELAAYAGEREDAAPLPDFTFGIETMTASRKVGAASVAVLLLTAGGVPWLVVPDWDPAPGATGAFASIALFAWLVGRFATFTLVAASEAAGPRAPDIQVDLLDLAPLARFGRIGLRLSLGWIGGISIFVLLSFLFPFFGEGGGALFGLLVPAFGATLVLATLALVIPVRGVRNRIRQAKQAALAELRSGIREARDAAVKGDLRVQGHLSDLLAYRAYVESLREWPFDTSTLVRFALYTLIPVGSWLGGALVERVVDAALG